MKHFKPVFAGSALAAVLLCAACVWWKHWDRTTSRLVDGSEAVYTGIVTDRAMSEFQDWHRAYISIELEDGSWLLFWEERGRDSIGDVSIGDMVEIECAMEEETGVLVAVRVIPAAAIS